MEGGDLMKKITISLDDDILLIIDSLASDLHLSRSAFIRFVVLSYQKNIISK